MPEALAAIPRDSLQTGNSSETDAASNTSRSTGGTKKSAESDSKQISAQTDGCNKASIKKTRKSNSRRSNHKKPQKFNTIQQKHQKTNAVLAAQQLKSQIPRPFQQLTPSSSATSLASSKTAKSATSASLHSSSPSGPSSPRLPVTQVQLQRQASSGSIRVHFRLRKSISQMDFKHARRTGNIHTATALHGGRVQVQDKNQENQRSNDMSHTKALMPKNIAPAQIADGPLRSAGLFVSHSQDTLVHKILQQDEYYVMMERDPKMAGMRIFATIMLNAWRKRRDEVRRLMVEVNDLKRGSIKAKNQLHVFNTLFRGEQKRNDELSCQLQVSLEDINRTKNSCESLTTSLLSLRADKALLEQQMQVKDQEFDGLNTIMAQTKSDLFKAMTQQRELQANLSMEQRKVQTLENQKNDLINEICELNNESLQKEEKLRAALQQKEQQLSKAQKDVRILESLAEELKVKNFQVQDFAQKELKAREEKEALEKELCELKTCLADTLSNRLKTYWSHTILYQKTTCEVLHWIAYYVLPATPPPKYSPPSTLGFHIFGLDKALQYIKR